LHANGRTGRRKWFALMVPLIQNRNQQANQCHHQGNAAGVALGAGVYVLEAMLKLEITAVGVNTRA